uniref:Uncharacterized protein n=1 Tax=Rhizophora mucronata TaxID=61149 RepID=A0A2P2N444_RHIMU
MVSDSIYRHSIHQRAYLGIILACCGFGTLKYRMNLHLDACFFLIVFLLKHLSHDGLPSKSLLSL